MSTYKINYEKFRQQPGLPDMLSALERGFKKFGIDFYLVGAVARNVWMSGINGLLRPIANSDCLDVKALFMETPLE